MKKITDVDMKAAYGITSPAGEDKVLKGTNVVQPPGVQEAVDTYGVKPEDVNPSFPNLPEV